jgi:UDP-glucose 4-epimerase
MMEQNNTSGSASPTPQSRPLNPSHKAVVFGGSGFLGSHVADELSNRGYLVTVFDARPSQWLREDQSMAVGDILDGRAVAGAVGGADVVYHFAGIAGLDDARRYPLRTIETNVLGTANILEACRLSGVTRFVFASTVYVYSDLAPFYRSSKQSCELIIEDYQREFGLDYTVLRYGSLYGRRANEFNFIYSIVRQAIEQRRIVRRGDGEELRDYIHVGDAARCSVDILAEEFKNQNVILTGTQSTRIKHLLEMIREIFQGTISIEYSKEPITGHYEITPYAFRPRIARKLVAGSYCDFGQGLLDVVYDVFSRTGASAESLEDITKLMGPDE